MPSPEFNVVVLLFKKGRALALEELTRSVTQLKKCY